MATYFFIGLLIKTFEVIATSVVNFLVTYLVSEILKTNDISHPLSCFIIMSILLIDINTSGLPVRNIFA